MSKPRAKRTSSKKDSAPEVTEQVEWNFPSIAEEDIEKLVQHFAKRATTEPNAVVAAIKKGYLQIEVIRKLAKTPDDLAAAATAFMKAPVVLVLLHEAGWRPTLADLQYAAKEKLYGAYELLASWLPSDRPFVATEFAALVDELPDEQFFTESILLHMPPGVLGEAGAPDLITKAIKNQWSFTTLRLIIAHGAVVTREAIDAIVSPETELPDGVQIGSLSYILSKTFDKSVIPTEKELENANPMVAFLCKEFASRTLPVAEEDSDEDLPPPVQFAV